VKKIWIINQYASTPLTDIGGRHRHFARELAAKGYDVVVVAARQSHLSRDLNATANAPAIEYFEGFRFVRLDVLKYRNANSIARIVSWIIFTIKLRHIPALVEDTPDVILCSSPSIFSFIGAECLSKKFNARLVFEVRDIWPQSLIEIGGYSKFHPFIMMMQYIEDRAYRLSDRVLSNLPNSMDHMVARGMDKEKFTWIPNGFSRVEMENTAELGEDYLALLPEGKFLIGYTGTFGVANALDTLLDAAKLLKDWDDIAFVLVGHGSVKIELERRVVNEQIKNVHILDPVSKTKVQSVLKLFDVCYLGLQRNDLFRFGVSPNKLFDYLVAAKPVIYAIDSGSYKPVTAFEAGISIPPESPDKLAAAVQTLYSMTADEREVLGNNGRQGAFKHHDYGILSKKLESVLLF